MSSSTKASNPMKSLLTKGSAIKALLGDHKKINKIVKDEEARTKSFLTTNNGGLTRATQNDLKSIQSKILNKMINAPLKI